MVDEVRRLDGTVALVTGASRGIGRGIAHELGLAGATVYVTGRTRTGKTAADGIPGTIDGTADLVTQAGGTGIPIQADHTDDDQVAALADRVREDHGRLDLLVNNVWGGYEAYDPAEWEQPFWEQPIERWDRMIDPGVRGHVTTTRAVLPLMLEAQGPLIVAISAGDEGAYLGDVIYDVAKHAQQRLAYALAEHLAPHGVTSLAVISGFARTERVLEAFGIGADDQAWQGIEELAESHTPRFVGRAVVALAADPDVHRKTAERLKVGALGHEYGFTDVDGRQPEPWSLPEGAP